MSHPIHPVARPPLQFWARLKAWLNALFIDHAFFRFFYNTRLRIAPGLHRSSHPMPYQLRCAQRAGVKSVLSLRGDETHLGSNQLEWDACAKMGLKLVHYPIGSRDAPSREQVLGIIELFRTLPQPILVHCKSGADRAGLASTIYLMTEEGRPYAEAIHQMDFWRHGHVKQAKTGILDLFFETYRQHHAAHGTPFEDWVRHHYDREAVRRSFHSSWWANQLVDRILRRE